MVQLLRFGTWSSFALYILCTALGAMKVEHKDISRMFFSWAILQLITALICLYFWQKLKNKKPA
jgi:membrane protein DedA with SNARE-associated domain